MKRKGSYMRGRGDYTQGYVNNKGITNYSLINWGQTNSMQSNALTGSGDYKMGHTPSSNSIWNSTATPKFQQRGRGNIITNREYIRDITIPALSNGQFHVERVVVQPGLATTFPWLATIAQNYEQFKILGMIFEFKSTLGDNSLVQNLGTVIMGTEYNVSSADFVNKQVMENSEFAQSARSTASQIHGIECASKESPTKLLYVRTGVLPSANVAAGDNLKWYDYANFQIATVGFPLIGAAPLNIGELWVSYQIEFFKPQIPSNIGGVVQTGHVYRTGAGDTDGLSILGQNTVYSSGNLSLEVQNEQMTIKGVFPSNVYALSLMWIGEGVNYVSPGVVFTGADLKALYNNKGNSAVEGAGAPGATDTVQAMYEIAFTANATSVTVALTDYAIPVNSGLDIWVRGIDNLTV